MNAAVLCVHEVAVPCRGFPAKCYTVAVAAGQLITTVAHTKTMGPGWGCALGGCIAGRTGVGDPPVLLQCCVFVY
jgi:hypothetical protein